MAVIVLDGFPVEVSFVVESAPGARLPRDLARRAFAEAWATRCLATDERVRSAAETAMDAVQGACVESGRPGPEWDEFAATLPGYLEHWRGLAEECDRMRVELARRLAPRGTRGSA